MTRPTDGAMRAAEQIMAENSHPVALESCARTIDREAVAPAVRELLETLGKINDTGPVWSSRPDYAEALEHSRAVFARYRHLIEESGE